MAAENANPETGESGSGDKIRRAVRGIVVSNAMDKTIVVKTERLVPHPKYRKFVRRHTKFHAHDESNRARVGDFVELVMTRPLSKKKRWLLDEIIREAPADVAEGAGK